jgi:malate synthase
MSAFIPDRTSPEITDRAIVAVQDEKRREAALGYDGAWVAHPDLVPTVLDVFAQALGERANQLTVQAPLGSVADLISTGIAGASASPEGFRSNIRIALTYILAWLGGNGAVAIDHLMEDAATAEISRCQIWQWIHHGTELSDGSTSTVALATDVLQDQAQKAIDDGADAALVDSAADLLRVAMLEMELPPFLTLLAYPHLL